MVPNPPQTLSVKRKRNEAPVDALVFEKKLKLEASYTYHRVQKSSASDSPSPSLPSPLINRRFRLDATGRGSGKHVLVEHRALEGKDGVTGGDGLVDSKKETEVSQQPGASSQETPRPRKRPGAGSALRSTKASTLAKTTPTHHVSEHDLRRFAALSKQVEKEEAAPKPPTSPSKYRPKAPALRYKDRHPEKAPPQAQNGKDVNAMDIDTDDYVYDTYVREVLMPDANGNMPEPIGTVGFIVIGEEDEDWWNGEEESDREFDTDDEDENAEDYYANDYPEDELSSDDEFDRDPYQRKYRHGSDNEEFDLRGDSDEDDEEEEDAAIRSDEDEDDAHFRMTASKTKPGYWGRFGE